MKKIHLLLPAILIALYLPCQTFGAAPACDMPSLDLNKLSKESWFTVTIDNAPVGYVHETWSRSPGSPEILQKKMESVIGLYRGEVGLNSSQTTTIQVRKDGTPLSYQFTMTEGTNYEKVDAVIKNSKMLIQYEGSRQERTKEVPFTEKAILDDLITDYTAMLDPGSFNECTIRTFSMEDLTFSTATIINKGLQPLPDSSSKRLILYEIPNTRIPARSVGIYVGKGIVEAVWLPPMKILMTKTDRETAMEALEGGAFDLSLYGRIPCTPKIKKPRDCRYLKLKLTGALEGLKEKLEERPEIKILRATDKDIILEISSINEPKSAVYLPVKETGLDQFLETSDFINWQNDMIQKVAEGITANEKNILNAAKKLCNWVYKNIRQQSLDTGMLPASEVLELKGGDCTELSVLLCALCRARGIPARSVFGLIYSEGYFDFHMWIEIYAGIWLPMDPVFNQTKVDATHIPMGSSNLDRFDLWELEDVIMLTMGQIQVEVLLQR